MSMAKAIPPWEMRRGGIDVYGKSSQTIEVNGNFSNLHVDFLEGSINEHVCLRYNADEYTTCET